MHAVPALLGLVGAGAVSSSVWTVQQDVFVKHLVQGLGEARVIDQPMESVGFTRHRGLGLGVIGMLMGNLRALPAAVAKTQHPGVKSQAPMAACPQRTLPCWQNAPWVDLVALCASQCSHMPRPKGLSAALQSVAQPGFPAPLRASAVYGPSSI